MVSHRHTAIYIAAALLVCMLAYVPASDLNHASASAGAVACITPAGSPLYAKVQGKVDIHVESGRADLYEMFTRTLDTMQGTDSYTTQDIKARPDKQDARWQGAGPNALWQSIYVELDRLKQCRASLDEQAYDNDDSSDDGKGSNDPTPLSNTDEMSATGSNIAYHTTNPQISRGYEIVDGQEAALLWERAYFADSLGSRQMSYERHWWPDGDTDATNNHLRYETYYRPDGTLMTHAIYHESGGIAFLQSYNDAGLLIKNERWAETGDILGSTAFAGTVGGGGNDIIIHAISYEGDTYLNQTFHESGHVHRTLTYDNDTGTLLYNQTYRDGSTHPAYNQTYREDGTTLYINQTFHQNGNLHQSQTYRPDGITQHYNQTYREDGSLHLNVTHWTTGWLRQVEERDEDENLVNVTTHRVQGNTNPNDRFPWTGGPTSYMNELHTYYPNGNKATTTTYWEPRYRQFEGDIAEIEGWHMDGSKWYEYSFTHVDRIWQLSLWPNPADNTCCFNRDGSFRACVWSVDFWFNLPHETEADQRARCAADVFTWPEVPCPTCLNDTWAWTPP